MTDSDSNTLRPNFKNNQPLTYEPSITSVDTALSFVNSPRVSTRRLEAVNVDRYGSAQSIVYQ